MRDIFEEIFENRDVDPTEAARRNMRPLRKRFYAQLADDANAVLLDGKPVRTPARRPLAAPNPAIARAMVGEWNAQGEQIDPATMPLTRLANAIIDGVADMPQPVADEIARCQRSGFLPRGRAPEFCRMAGAPLGPGAGLCPRRSGAHFVLAEGVVFQHQPEQALTAARRAIPDDPWLLGALSTVTTLTGSALIALALLRGALTVEEAWAAAHADEGFSDAAVGP